MKDYAKGRVKRGARLSSLQYVLTLIREACALAYADGQKSERKRCARIVRKWSAPERNWQLDTLRKCIEEITRTPRKKKGAKK